MRLLLITLFVSMCAYGQNVSQKIWSGLTTSGATASFSVAGNDKHTVTVTGAPGTCTMKLEGSLDDSTWFDISGGTQTCTSALIFFITDHAVMFVRANMVTLGSGTAAVSYIGIRSGGRR